MMKIAIPTHDGLMIAPLYEQARGFLVLTIELGEIQTEELRWITRASGKAEPIFAQIADCSYVIVKKIEDPSCTSLKEHGITCLKTDETIITNIVLRFMENELRKASDTCCCP